MDKIILNEVDEDFLIDLGKKKGEFYIEEKTPFYLPFELYIERLNMQAVVKKVEEEYLTISLYQNDKDFLCSYSLSKSMNISNFRFAEMEAQKDFEAQIQLWADYITWLLVFLSYVVNNYREYQILNIKEVVSHTIKKSNKNNKFKKSKVVRVVHKVIRLNNNPEVRERIKKTRQWHIDEFTRRGHYRQMKDGRKIWVRPTIIKTYADTGNKGDKTYRL